jgi:hypothetical protein
MIKHFFNVILEQELFWACLGDELLRGSEQRFGG